ncbi:MAG: oxidoreductase [Cyanobacteria bacterium QH_6_48_35]|jgi:predicted aldo/keto reductase-like oxidoreductase|nr:MAG: oxidoreductase [Cyanobacteria bacterium QH_10_48_56]PSO61164.1 MAG: oxidoreductase [Cyanobacteria bacterium QH_7_48_89]PSO66208.1 MAG: oxidoreductase [Cyanobacteria bacterium QH_6_48_35]PSO71493.1 MAG: oxidoreductase [Cyanobacteria bacterium QH_3_48_40]PSO80399.1 MAG: oxidoreductase [Cyanobacteria bacterium QS_4_48_99]PSO88116.1 MAG: oxidoreductase [Cyanobacteria bacterium QH_9_48_43]PSP14681.1 MAG: oxidoreductase [Cyanobacteria bacterium SW_11_48_12]PSP26602.1 MAG: oxidoreductase [C
MRYRRFGKTNLMLSVFSLGTMRCLANEAEYAQTLQQAVAQGINHLETARGYGKSEEYLGQALKAELSVPREQLHITTKLPPTPDADQMRQWIDHSLERLQLDYLDGLAIHGINTWEHLAWVKEERGCMEAITEAVADGRVRHVGFSTHATLDIILAAIETDLFEFVNLHYYYFFQRHDPAVERAHEKDMGIFIISPADKGGQLYTPPETLKQLCHPFSPLELNYRFLLSDRRITTLSVGPANPEELRDPLKVADHDAPLSDSEIEAFQRLEAQLEDALGTDKCSQCYQCLPCPEKINIPEVLRLRNLAVAYEMTDFGQYRYRMFENAGHWFPGAKGNRCTDCGDCLPRCPENLDIPALLRDTHQRLNGSPRRRLWG